MAAVSVFQPAVPHGLLHDGADSLYDSGFEGHGGAAASAAATAAAVAVDVEVALTPIADAAAAASADVSTPACSEATPELRDYVAGQTTVRGLPRTSRTADAPAPGSPFPSMSDALAMFDGHTRMMVVNDARSRYQVCLRERGGLPVFLDSTEGGKRSTVYMAVTPGGAKVAIKATCVVDTPPRLRTVYANFAELVGTAPHDMNLVRQLIAHMTPLCGDELFPAQQIKNTETAALGIPSRTLLAEHMNWRVDPYMEAHEAWFGMAFVEMCLRLYKQVCADTPPGYTGTLAEWREQLAIIFGPIRETASELLTARGPCAFDSASLRQRGRFDSDINSEANNSLVAGGHWSLLHYSGACSALAPLLDYWSIPTSGAHDDPGPRVLFTVMPHYDYGLGEFMHEKPLAKTTLCLMRSALAQALANLAVAQHLVSFSHCDAHVGNVRISRMRSGMREFGATTWAYRVPSADGAGTTTLYIPAADTGGRVVRFIDQDRSHSLHPCDPTDRDRSACYPLMCAHDEADMTLDSRLLIIDLMFFSLSHWRGEINRVVALDCLDAPLTPLDCMILEFWDVVEAMAGISTWSAWMGSGYQLHDGNLLEDPTSFLNLWNHFSDTETVFGKHRFRSEEIFSARTDGDVNVSGPSAVLRLPFFDAYTTPSASSEGTVAFAADCTVDVAGMLKDVYPAAARVPAPESHASSVHTDVAMAPPGSVGISPDGSP